MQVTRECSEDRLGRRGLQSDNGDNNGAVVFGLFELVALEGKLSCLRRGEAECSGAGFADLPVHRSTTRVHKTTRLTLKCHSALWTVNPHRIGRGSPSRVAKGCILDAARACELDVAAQLPSHEPRNEAWSIGRPGALASRVWGANRKMSAGSLFGPIVGPATKASPSSAFQVSNPSFFPAFPTFSRARCDVLPVSFGGTLCSLAAKRT